MRKILGSLVFIIIIIGCGPFYATRTLSELKSTYALNFNTMEEYIEVTTDPQLKQVLKVAEPAGFEKIKDINVAPSNSEKEVYIYAIPTWRFGGIEDEQIFFLEIDQEEEKPEWYGPFLGKLISLMPKS